MVTLADAQLAAARHLVETCLLHPAGDAVGGDRDGGSEAATAFRAAAGLLDRIGWPADPRRIAHITDADATLIRFAALAGLGALGEAIDDAASAAARDGARWDADGTISEFEDIVGLLDVIGWPDGSARARSVDAPAPSPEDAELIAFGDRLPTPLYLWRDNRIHHRNPAALALLRAHGLSPDEAPVMALIHPHDRAALTAHITAAEAEQRPFREEIRFGPEGGPHRRFMLSGAPRFGADGGFLGFVVLAVDSPVERAGLLHWHTDRDAGLSGATDGFLRYLGLDLPAALGDGWLHAVHADDRALLRAALAEAHARRDALSVSVRVTSGGHVVRLLAQPRLEPRGFGGMSGVLVPVGPADGDLR